MTSVLRRATGRGPCLFAVLIAISMPASLLAQEAGGAPLVSTTTPWPPMTEAERVDWIVGGTIGPGSLAVGVLESAVATGIDRPSEWGRSWTGFGKRYLQREADVAISSTIEAGLGALWGEEPRYVRSGLRGGRRRLSYALRTVFLAQRRDGRLAPAWGRYAANVFNNVIENTWLPPSATTWDATVIGSLEGFLSRAAGNIWEEFWPDVRRRVFRRRDVSDHSALDTADGALATDH